MLWRDRRRGWGCPRQGLGAVVEEMPTRPMLVGPDDETEMQAFLDELRNLGQGPPPPPSASLSRMLGGTPAGRWLRVVNDDDLPAGSSPGSWDRTREAAAGGSRGRAWTTTAALGRAAVPILVVLTAATSAGAHLLPERAQHTVARAIERVTPFELDDGDDDGMSRQSTATEEGNGDDSVPRVRGRRLRRGTDCSRRGIRWGGAGSTGGRIGARVGPTARYSRGRWSRDRPHRSTTVIEGRCPSEPSGRWWTGRHPTLATPVIVADDPAHAVGTPSGCRRPGVHRHARRGRRPKGSGDPDGSGLARVSLQSGKNLLCVSLTTSGVAPVTSVHLHSVSPTSPDPVVATPAPNSSGSPTCVPVDAEVLRAIHKNPTDHYLDVHNDEFPDGALRGYFSR